MAKELPFASLKEAVDTINMTGRKESYRHATMADFDDIYEMVKLQLPYFPRLKPEQKEEIANNVKKAIARHDMRVLPIKGTIAFFASYNTEIPSVVSFGYRAVPGVNEALVATWALKHCLSSFRHEYNTNTFYVDAGADNSKFGRSNAVDLLEKKSGMNNYKIISGHRFYSITIESKPSEFADKSQGA